MTFLGKQDGPHILLLGGRAWLVNHIDWQRRIAYVEATEAKGRSRWKGEGQRLTFRLCQQIKQVLAADDNRAYWSNRARRQIEEVRSEFAWLSHEGTAIVQGENDEVKWWTFAGAGANTTLAYELSQALKSQVTYDSFAVTFARYLSVDVIEQALYELLVHDVKEMHPAVEEHAIDGLKFSACLPPELAIHMLESRLGNLSAVENTLHQPQRIVVSQ
jgi:ATP-dependent Lhr-like helicase